MGIIICLNGAIQAFPVPFLIEYSLRCLYVFLMPSVCPLPPRKSKCSYIRPTHRFFPSPPTFFVFFPAVSTRLLDDPDLYLKASVLLLSRVMTGGGGGVKLNAPSSPPISFN